ncbi:MAG: DUF4340 domain-containing protein [Polyangiaceae bacterium]
MSAWRSQRTNVLLIVVALLLVAVVFWDRGRVSTNEANERVHNLLDAWRPDAILGMRAEASGHRYRLEGVRETDGTRSWKFHRDDAEAELDPQGLAGLLTTLEFGTFQRLVTDETKSLGMENPVLSIELDMPPLRYALRIGGPAPAPAGAYYAEVRGGARGRRRYVIPGKLKTSLETGLAELRSRQVVPYVSSEVSRIDYRSAPSTWRLTRAAWPGRVSAGLLIRQSDETVRVSRRVAHAWLVALGRLNLLTLLDAPPPQPPAAHFEFFPRDETRPTAKLAIYGRGSCPEGQRVMVRTTPDPACGCVEDKLITQLSLPAGKLRDPYVFGARTGDVIEIRAAGTSSTLEIARRDRGWIMRKPHSGKADGTAGDEWLKELLAVQGELLPYDATVDRERFGLQSPTVQLSVRSLAHVSQLKGGGRERVERVDVGQVRDGFVHVLRHDDGQLLRIPVAATDALRSDASRLSPRQLSDVHLKEVAALKVDCRGRSQHLLRGPTGDWAMQSPAIADLPADMGLASELADGLRKITAVRWATQASAGPSKSWCALELRFKASEREPLRIELYAATEGGFIAQQVSPRSAHGRYFVAPRRLGRLADQWLFDRGALLVDTTRVKRIELRGPKAQKLILRRQSGHWLKDDKDADLLGTRVIEALKGIVAEAVWDVSIDPANFENRSLRIDVTLDDDTRRTFDVGSPMLWRQVKTRFVRTGHLPVSFLVDEARLLPLSDLL